MPDGCWALGWLPLLCAWANLPCTFITCIVMLPVTSPTPSSAAICASFFAEMDCWPGAVMTAERSNFLPWLSWSGGFMLNCCEPPWSILACCDTVMSVPTPYSDCRTWSCALLTPPAYAVTATTSATPTARPSAVSSAWRCRRRSSLNT